MIRHATDADYDELEWVLWRLAAGSAYTGGAVLNRTHLHAMLTRLLGNPDTGFLVAEREGDIVGLLVLMLSPHLISGARKASEVCWWVDRKHRDGTGLRLLRTGEAWARNHGAASLEMLAPDQKFDAVYSRRGYVLTARVFERRL